MAYFVDVGDVADSEGGRTPAGDRCVDEVLGGDEQLEHNEDEGRVTTVEPVTERLAITQTHDFVSHLTEAL